MSFISYRTFHFEFLHFMLVVFALKDFVLYFLLAVVANLLCLNYLPVSERSRKLCMVYLGLLNSCFSSKVLHFPQTTACTSIDFLPSVIDLPLCNA